LTAAAALAAWLGGSLIVLSDGRRGLAAGLALVGAALGGLAWATGEPYGALALAAGGLAGAGLRLRVGPPAWGLMEPGSTPRIILTVVAGLFALWIAVTVSSGDQAALRFGILAVLGLAGARLLYARELGASLTAAAALALVMGAAAGVISGDAWLASCLVAALIAIAASVFSPRETVGT
jgi:hypothetical protein